MGKRKMPYRREIARYWVPKLIGNKYWLDAYYDIPDANKYWDDVKICFACGAESSMVERCHIKPKTLGGADSIENLHLLCPYCHKESEHISGFIYDTWFKNKSPLESSAYKSKLNIATAILAAYPNKTLEEYRDIIQKEIH